MGASRSKILQKAIMKNIIMVVPNIPYFDTNHGDWRIYSLCKLLSKRYNIYLLPLRYDWINSKHEKILRKTGIRIIYPGTNNAKRFRRILKTKKVETVIFRSHYTIEKFTPYFDLLKNVIIDTHELEYEKVIRS